MGVNAVASFMGHAMLTNRNQELGRAAQVIADLPDAGLIAAFDHLQDCNAALNDLVTDPQLRGQRTAAINKATQVVLAQIGIRLLSA